MEAAAPPRPEVSEQEFVADQAYVDERLRPVAIGDWSTRVLDEGSGEAVFFVPIIRGLEVVYAKQIQAYARRRLGRETDDAIRAWWQEVIGALAR